MLSFSVQAMVRGYHVYKDIWDAVVGEEFPCRCKNGNRVDPFAVAIVRGNTVIGHVLRKILSIYSLYFAEMVPSFAVRRVPNGSLVTIALSTFPGGRLPVQNFMQLKFRTQNFRTFLYGAKYVKICTDPKFPAIR